MDATTQYMEKISNHPLLTREGEVELARQIEAGRMDILDGLVADPIPTFVVGAILGQDRSIGGSEVAIRKFTSNLERLRRLRASTGATDPAQERTLALELSSQGDLISRLVVRIGALRQLLAGKQIGDAELIEIREELSGQLSARALRALDQRMRPGYERAQRAKNDLVQSNVRLVLPFARKAHGPGFQFLDLIQEGNLGLMRAADKFDHRKGFRFSTYAIWWVRQAIARALAEKGRTIRVPVHKLDKHRRVYHASIDLSYELGREPTVEELANTVNLSEDQVTDCLALVKEPLSLDAPVQQDDARSLLETVVSPDDKNAEEELRAQRRRRFAGSVLRILTPREKEIVRMRFGLEGQNELTLREVGETMGVSRERIRQIETQALEKLRALCTA